jgi:hypothetical protein
MFDPDVVLHDPVYGESKGTELVRKSNQALFKAIPDIQGRILSMAVSDDVAALELMLTGTFKNPIELAGRTLPPTGCRLEHKFASFGRVNAKGLVSEVTNYSNPAALLQQLGLKM